MNTGPLHSKLRGDFRFARVVLAIVVGTLLVARSEAKTPPKDPTDEAFRLIMAAEDFPAEFYPEFTRTEIRKATPKALAAVRKSRTVFRIDFDNDALVDYVIQIPPHARNGPFYVLHRRKNGWKILLTFVGQEFSFHGFAGWVHPMLSTMAHSGGGHVTTVYYKFEDGKFVESGSKSEQLKEEHAEEPEK